MYPYPHPCDTVPVPVPVSAEAAMTTATLEKKAAAAKPTGFVVDDRLPKLDGPATTETTAEETSGDDDVSSAEVEACLCWLQRCSGSREFLVASS